MTVKKGDFITGAEPPADVCRRRGIVKGAHLISEHAASDKALQVEFPFFSDMIRAAGPPPSDEKLKKLAAERRQLEQRMRDIAAKIAAFQAYRKRT